MRRKSTFHKFFKKFSIHISYIVKYITNVTDKQKYIEYIVIDTLDYHLMKSKW